MTPLGLFYRRIRSGIGGLGAVKATAHKLACLVCRMLKYGQEYVTRGWRSPGQGGGQILGLRRKAAAMGFDSLRCRRRRAAKAVAVWPHAYSDAGEPSVLRHRFRPWG